MRLGEVLAELERERYLDETHDAYVGRRHAAVRLRTSLEGLEERVRATLRHDCVLLDEVAEALAREISPPESEGER